MNHTPTFTMKYAIRVILFITLLAFVPTVFAQQRIRERIAERIKERAGNNDGGQSNGKLRDRLKNRDRGESGDVEKATIAGLDCAIWRPAQSTPAPLVIFSHGFHGNNTQSTFLMEALAKAGYLVVAPNHKDASSGGISKGRPEVSFRDADQWSANTYKDRGQDIVNLLEGLHQVVWSAQIDWSRVALSGHSLGGYTTLGLAGAWPSWKISGIKAVLALSPYCACYVVNGNLGSLGVPVMYQGGTRDFGITPGLKKPGGAYDKTASPVYFVEFDGVGHFGFSNVNKSQEQKDLINHYSIAFLDKYVKGESNADLKQKLPGVTELRAK